MVKARSSQRDKASSGDTAKGRKKGSRYKVFPSDSISSLAEQNKEQMAGAFGKCNLLAPSLSITETGTGKVLPLEGGNGLEGRKL